VSDPLLNDGNKEDAADMLAVHSMLERARYAHMSVEVVLSFSQYIKRGDSIVEAARCAAYDWDC
jgi:hypothetical protein